MSEETKNLILICEGGAHTVEYFHRNGVFPSSVVFETTKFKEMSPYLSKDDDILVLITGLTDFTLKEIYALFNDLEEAENQVGHITIISSIKLGLISVPYYLYQGDLFYGKIKLVENNKVTDIEVVEDTIDKSKKGKRGRRKGKSDELSENTVQSMSINAVLSRYKKYNKKDVKFTIYGSHSKEVTVQPKIEGVIKKLVDVDLYQN